LFTFGQTKKTFLKIIRQVEGDTDELANNFKNLTNFFLRIFFEKIVFNFVNKNLSES